MSDVRPYLEPDHQLGEARLARSGLRQDLADAVRNRAALPPVGRRVPGTYTRSPVSST
jgi:hypothetical protein